MPRTGVGVTVIRKEACDKVTGAARYTGDMLSVGMLTARAVTSTCAHGTIKRIDASQAAALAGVRAVVTGEDAPVLCGALLEDRPPAGAWKGAIMGNPSRWSWRRARRSPRGPFP